MHLLDVKIKNHTLRIKHRFLTSLLIISAFFIVNPLQASSKVMLSGASKISVLTCGPGQALYATYGHTALWVSDPENNIDEVFNYGTFDFNTSNFYLKFLSGTLDYELDVSSFDEFIAEYIIDERWVNEQELLVSNTIKQKIYDSLCIVRLPENKFYRYDFFRNNCSSKVFDIVLAFTANQAIIDTLKTETAKTFRKALRPYIAGRSWVNLGINLLLGPFADQQMSKIQSTFLPEDLMYVISETGIAGLPQTLYQGTYQLPVAVDPEISMILFWVLLIALVIEALWSKTSQKTSDRIDVVLFSIPALFGLLFMILWVWSYHVALHVNLNLLWANPLTVFLIIGIVSKKPLFTKIILILYGFMIFFALVNWGRMPQKLPLEIMPFVTILAFRVVNRIFKFKVKDRLMPANKNF